MSDYMPYLNADDDLRSEVDELRSASAATSTVVHRLHRERERYRLAWMSARQRAMNHLLALVESDDERDGLRAALADEQGSHAMTASSFEIFVESMAEQARAAEAITNGYKAEIAKVQQSAIEHSERHRRIFEAHLRQVAELTDERDEARAEVVQLGKALEAAQISAEVAVSTAHREAGTW